MDADRNIIPIVEGDQGEGFMDEIDPLELPEEFGEIAQEKLNKSLQAESEKKGEFEKLAKESMQSPQPRPMTIKKGMVIHFYGFAYKCTAARPNGKVTLKFKGPWKGDQR